MNEYTEPHAVNKMVVGEYRARHCQETDAISDEDVHIQ